jgi:rod shape-determining protein MreD
MYSLFDRFLLLLPAAIAVMLVMLAAMPMHLGAVTLTPNVAWLMTIALATVYPPAWGYGIAFVLGLLQDVIYATPLGAQALLSVLLLAALRARPQRVANPMFRLVWAEAAFLLVACHALLWVILYWVGPSAPPILPLLITGGVNALWFPIFYWPLAGLASLLPQRG